MLDLAVAYEETHHHLAELVRELNHATLATKVAASPDWSVQDVIAHVTGIAANAVQGDFPEDLDILGGMTNREQADRRDALTADHVAARRGRRLAEILDEWGHHLRELLPMIRGERPFPQFVPFAEAVVVTDLAVHAQDVRGTLRIPGDRDSAGVSVALVSYAGALGLRLQAAAVPALRIVYGGKERIAGPGEAAATWEGDRFEIFRALAGRRSTGQIRGMSWTGDPEPYLPLIPAYGERLDPIEE